MADKKEKVVKQDGEILVSDPVVFKKQELPLVVTPADGKWKNPQQEEYAKTVNAYAYKNPEKWANNRVGSDGKEIPESSKKAVLLKRLKEIGDNPSLLNVYNGGGNGNISINNKLIG